MILRVTHPMRYQDQFPSPDLELSRHPRFESENAAEIATGVGGILFMLIGASLLVLVVISSMLPTTLFIRMIERGSRPDPEWIAAAVGFALLTFLIPLAGGRIAVAFGARHLEAGE